MCVCVCVQNLFGASLTSIPGLEAELWPHNFLHDENLTAMKATTIYMWAYRDIYIYVYRNA